MEGNEKDVLQHDFVRNALSCSAYYRLLQLSFNEQHKELMKSLNTLLKTGEDKIHHIHLQNCKSDSPIITDEKLLNEAIAILMKNTIGEWNEEQIFNQTNENILYSYLDEFNSLNRIHNTLCKYVQILKLQASISEDWNWDSKYIDNYLNMK